MQLFQKVDFVGAAGKSLSWRIECDALTDTDWKAIADICGPKLPPFDQIFPVPTGGFKLAHHLKPYRTQGVGVSLFVDDVWTTGRSMLETTHNSKITSEWVGFVAFMRGTPHESVPVYSFLRVGGFLSD